MSAGYTNNGKRISSMGHARHTWTCVCGKKVRGNGGKSSHQRACHKYLTDRYVRRCVRLTTYPWNLNDAGMRLAHRTLMAGVKNDWIELRRRGGLLLYSQADLAKWEAS